MPYTPPSQRSPASSKPNSPVISRAHSYVNEVEINPPSTRRPSLPRSISSTSYLNKHRRTPSLPHNNGTQGSGTAQTQDDRRVSPNGSLRQSPLPVNNLLIPTGAITTPPDSASDDEERGRELGSLAELQEALQSIKQRRSASPEREAAVAPVPLTRVTSSTPPPALTPEARKISHSRSSSEIQLSSLATNIDGSPVIASDESDDEDELGVKPPLLRKKSGELVKPALRPTSSRRRPSSMPGTPTFSKAVHFNDNIEQVRHFLQVDRPIAVSAGSSPVEVYDSDMEYPFEHDGIYMARKVEWEIKLANFPKETLERKSMPVYVERIFLASDNKTLIGTVAVANIAFHKAVFARFTLDYWKTTSEVVAEYNNDVRKKQSNDGYDRFNFNIKLTDQANLERKTLLLCVKYMVNNQEFWDNNNNMNFQVDFIKKKGAANSTKRVKSVSNIIPRSRHNISAGRPKSFPSAFEDDFSAFGPKYQFHSEKSLLPDAPNTIRLKSRSSQLSQQQASSLQFSTRYDFSASLSAALSTAQSVLGDKSGITLTEPPKNKVRAAPKVDAPAPGVVSPRPDTISSEKPDLKSAEYNELIQKFCFFGTPLGKSPPATPEAQVSGNESDSSGGSHNSSGCSTPEQDMMSPQMDGASGARSPSKSPTHFLSRSNSRGSLTGSDFPERTQSPVNFGYPYNHGAMHHSILGDSHGPQPIIG